MSGTSVVYVIIYLLIALLAISLPWFSRKNVLFGVVFGSDSFRKDETAQKILRRYLRETIAVAAVIGAAAALYGQAASPGEAAGAFAFAISVFVLLFGTTIPYITANRRTLAFKAAQAPDANLVSDKITVEMGMSDKNNVLSAAWLLLLLPVLLATLALAVFGYDAMPAQLPIHYSFTAADAYLPKSWSAALLPVLLESLLGGLLLICGLFMRRAPASVRGNPDAAPGSIRFRKYMIFLLIVLGVLTELTFLVVEIGYFIPLSPLWLNLLTIFILLLSVILIFFYFRYVRAKKPTGPIYDDDTKWVLGLFYFNRSDPSLFVEKRVGIGYTINFARPGAWIFFLGILAVVLFRILFSSGSQ